MAHYTDWLPATRDGQLSMAKGLAKLRRRPSPFVEHSPNVIAELGTLIQTAETALDTAKNENARTPCGNRPMQGSL